MLLLLLLLLFLETAQGMMGTIGCLYPHPEMKRTLGRDAVIARKALESTKVAGDGRRGSYCFLYAHFYSLYFILFRYIEAASRAGLDSAPPLYHGKSFAQGQYTSMKHHSMPARHRVGRVQSCSDMPHTVPSWPLVLSVNTVLHIPRHNFSPPHHCADVHCPGLRSSNRAPLPWHHPTQKKEPL